MRVNIYAEEMTTQTEIISKTIDGHKFTGLRIYLNLPVTVNGEQYKGPFIHRPGDDDSSAVTFWGKRDLRELLRKMLTELDDHYAAYGQNLLEPEGVWEAWHGGECPLEPHEMVRVKFRHGIERVNIGNTRANRWDWSHEPGRPGDIIAFMRV